jgi:hypothetical protein
MPSRKPFSHIPAVNPRAAVIPHKDPAAFRVPFPCAVRSRSPVLHAVQPCCDALTPTALSCCLRLCAAIAVLFAAAVAHSVVICTEPHSPLQMHWRIPGWARSTKQPINYYYPPTNQRFRRQAPQRRSSLLSSLRAAKAAAPQNAGTASGDGGSAAAMALPGHRHLSLKVPRPPPQFTSVNSSLAFLCCFVLVSPLFYHMKRMHEKDSRMKNEPWVSEVDAWVRDGNAAEDDRGR